MIFNIENNLIKKIEERKNMTLTNVIERKYIILVTI